MQGVHRRLLEFLREDHAGSQASEAEEHRIQVLMDGLQLWAGLHSADGMASQPWEVPAKEESRLTCQLLGPCIIQNLFHHVVSSIPDVAFYEATEPFEAHGATQGLRTPAFFGRDVSPSAGLGLVLTWLSSHMFPR